MEHDINRHVQNLWDALSQDKRSIAMLLGAGCPLSIKSAGVPLIPDISGLTEIVNQQLKANPSYNRVLSNFSTDGDGAPNIEKILSHIRALRQVCGSDKVRGLDAAAITELESDICTIISKTVDKQLPTSSSPYHAIARWAGAIPRSTPVQFFTTNYDLLLEQSLEETRVPFFDGFVGSRNSFLDTYAIEEDKLPSRWARLWKLHGSINWYQTPTGAVCRMSQDRGMPRIIHPSHLKYDESRKMPYLVMLDRLKHFLRQPAAILVTCGYSFCDEHLNEVLVQGLQGNPTGAIFGLLYGSLQNYSGAIGLATIRPNLSLISENEAIIGTTRAPWAVQTNATAESKAIDKSNLTAIKCKLGDFSVFAEFLQ